MGRSRGLRSFDSYILRNVKHINHCHVARIKVVDSEIKKSVKSRADPDLNQAHNHGLGTPRSSNED